MTFQSLLAIRTHGFLVEKRYRNADALTSEKLQVKLFLDSFSVVLKNVREKREWASLYEAEQMPTNWQNALKTLWDFCFSVLIVCPSGWAP